MRLTYWPTINQCPPPFNHSTAFPVYLSSHMQDIFRTIYISTIADVLLIIAIPYRLKLLYLAISRRSWGDYRWIFDEPEGGDVNITIIIETEVTDCFIKSAELRGNNQYIWPRLF